jgi:hypothetical protein
MENNLADSLLIQMKIGMSVGIFYDTKEEISNYSIQTCKASFQQEEFFNPNL